MKLYIDDLRKEPQGWTRAKTVSEAIRILATQDVEEVSIDHDISHRVNMDSIARPFPCGETFEPVAWFIREMWGNGRKRERMILSGNEFDSRVNGMIHYEKVNPPKVTLHTANPIGAKKMAEILADAGIIAEIVLGMPVNGLE